MVSGLTGNAAVYPAPSVAVLKGKGDILLSSILRRVCWILGSDFLHNFHYRYKLFYLFYLNSLSRIEIPVP